MKVKEFAEMAKSELRCLSAYSGKVLCYRFDKEKHIEIGERELLDVWADIHVVDSGFGNYARPYLCAYVDGQKECDAAWEKKNQEKNFAITEELPSAPPF